MTEPFEKPMLPAYNSETRFEETRLRIVNSDGIRNSANPEFESNKVSAMDDKKTNETSKNAKSGDSSQEKMLKRATFGGGCFWCTEAVFLELKGVEKVVSGYTGGSIKNPTYEQVCSGLTGHAEVIQIEFDPNVIKFEQLLDVFFHTHDPTTLNRQGADVGTQYRSSVFFHDEEQKEIAKKVIAELDKSGDFDDPIVTKLEEMKVFYPAEDYHQNYFAQNPGNPYCRAVVAPKVSKFMKRYKEMAKKEK